jgi:curved DNA-binding protein CbpA
LGSKRYDNHYSTDLQEATQIMAPEHQSNGDGLYLRLEVRPGASQEEIARAYRRLAHDAHPDAHPGDPDAPRRFREITEAYEVLGDSARRERYDRARRPALLGTGTTCRAPAERSPGPGLAQVFASPPVTGGLPVFLGTGPATNPGPGLSVGAVEVRPSGYRPPTLPAQEDVMAVLLARLLSDIVEPWWRS